MRWNKLVRGKWYQSPTISHNSVPQPRYLNFSGHMEDIKGNIQCHAANMNWMYSRDEWTEIPNPKEVKAEVWLKDDKFVRATSDVPQNMPEVRIIMMDDTNLYIDTDGTIESLDYDAWKSHKFMAAPVGDKTTVSFIQE